MRDWFKKAFHRKKAAEPGADATPPELPFEFSVEPLENRVLLSATWIDADTGNEIPAATDGDDIFMGTAANDTADGGLGEDVMFGGAGDDTLDGGGNSDVLIGGAGNDTLWGGDGADVILTGAGDDLVQAGVGIDVIQFTGAENGDVKTVYGGSGDDTIDLVEFGSGAVAHDDVNKILTVDLGNDESFTIHYDSVESILTADGDLLGYVSGNEAPVVEAGDAQYVTYGDSVALDSTGTSDGDLDALTYKWVQVGGPSVTLSDPTAANPTFTAPDASGEVVFAMIVSDGTTERVDTVSVNVYSAEEYAPRVTGVDAAGTEDSAIALTIGYTPSPGSDGTGDFVTIVGVPSDASLSAGTEGVDGSWTVAVGDLDGLTLTPGPHSGTDFDLTVITGSSSAIPGEVFREDFSDGSTAGWTQVGNYSESWTTVDGKLVEDSPAGESIQITSLGGGDLTLDYSLSADIEMPTSGTNDSVGLVFNYTDYNNCYIAVWENAGDSHSGAGGYQKLSIIQVSGGVRTTIATAEPIDLGEAFNMEVQVDSGGIHLLADGTELLTAAGHTPNLSTFGLYSFHNDDGVAIDNVVVKDLTATDETDVATLRVTVTEVADAVDLTANDVTAAQYDPINLDITAALIDADGSESITSLKITGVPPGMTVGNGTDLGGGVWEVAPSNIGSITVAPGGGYLGDVTFGVEVVTTDTGGDTELTSGSFMGTWGTPPAVDAGADAAVDENNVYQLSGSSTDPYGQGLVYEWVQISGPTVTLSDTGIADPTFTAPDLVGSADVVFELRVTNGNYYRTDSVTITVNADNDGPTADAGIDQTVDEGDVVVLSGNGTDPEGEALTYTWVQTGGPTVVLDDASAASPTFTAPEGLVNTDYTFELQVSDGTNVTTDTVIITVNADDDAPVATAGGFTNGAWNYEYFDLAGSWYGNLGEAGFTQDGGSSSEHVATTTGVASTFDPSTFDTGDHFGLRFTSTLQIDTAGDYYFGTYADDGVKVFVDGVEVLTDDGLHSAHGVGSNAVSLTAGDHVVTLVYFENAGDQILDFGMSGPDTGDDWIDLATYANAKATIQDPTVEEGQTFQLSGHGVDPEDQSLTYEWVQTAGPTVTLSDSSAASPTFTAPEGLVNTDVTFELRVSDGTNTSIDTVTVTIEADNDAPSAEAGPNQTVNEGDVVTLTGSGTDPEGEALTYTWVQTGGPTVTLDDASAAAPTFTAPEGLVNSDITFELQVSDGTNTSTDTVTITVNADNDAPSAEAGPNQVVSEGDVVALAGSGTDPEGQGLTYTWVQTAGPAVTLDDPSASAPTFTAPDGLTNTDLTFELQVSDGTNTSTDTVTITVNANNDAPSANAGPDKTVQETGTYAFVGAGTDPEGQSLTYEWVQLSGPTITVADPTGPNSSYTIPEVTGNTTAVFELRVSDGTNTSVDTITLNILGNNDGPSADAGADQLVTEGDLVTLTGSGTDPEGEALTYTWVQTGGPTVTLDDASATAPTFTAPEGLVNTDISFQLQVSDGTNTVADTVIITVNADNDAPSAEAGPSADVQEGGTYALAGSGSDPEGQGLTYTWVQLSGPTIALDDPSDPNTRFTVPELLENGTAVFELRVSDGTNVSTDTVALSVYANNDGPSADAGADQVVTEGDVVALAGSGTDPEGQALTYTWVQTGGPTVTLDDASAATPTFTAPEGLVNSDITFELQVSDGTNTTTDAVVITVNADNDAPSANAGPDQAVDEGDVVALAGSGSDPEGQGLNYTWVQTAGPSVVLDDPSATSPTFTAPEGLVNSMLAFELQVSDGTTVSTDTVTITVNADNDAPSANAGPNQVVTEGDPVTLAGSGTDPEGQELAFTWIQTGGPTVVLDDPNATSPTFTAPEGLVNTDITFALQVSDGTSTSTDTVTIAVNADNDAPSANAGPDQVVSEGEPVVLAGSGTDPEGQALTYTWVQTSGPAVTLDDPNATAPTFTAPEGLVNTDVTFELRVSDGTNVSADTVVITVNADNDAPSANAGPDQVATEGDLVTLAGSGVDPEGQALTYTWVQTSGPAVTLDDPNATAPTFTAPEGLVNTDVTFELRVSDGTNVSADTVVITVNADNDAPSANAGPDQVATEGDLVTLAGSGVDPEGQGLTYTWVQTSGPTVVLSDPGATNPTFTAPEGLVNTHLTFELQVSDGTNVSTDAVAITINADNDAPTVDAGPDQTVDEGDVVLLAGSGTDPEGQGLTYTWVQTGGPSVTLDDVHATAPTFTAPEGLVNTDITFELRASDGTNVAVDTLVVTVNADDDAPTADAGPDQTVDEDLPVQLNGSGLDPEGQPLTYTWIQTGGPSVTLDDAGAAAPVFTAPNGLVNTDISFRLEVSDGVNTAVDTVVIHVQEDNDAPSADAGPDQVVEEGELVALAGSGTDPEGQGLTYTWVQVGGPTVVLDDATATAPSFTAPEGLVNTDLTFELRVSDGTNTSTDTVLITVNADDDAPTAEAGANRAVEEGDTLTLSGDGTDPEGRPLTFTWVQIGGPEVELDDANGRAPSFVAPEGLADETVTFELRVSDGVNVSSDTVTITILADDDAPVVEAGANCSAEPLETVRIAGFARDPEGRPMTYEWVQVAGPEVVVENPHALELVFEAPALIEADDIVFELRASDGTTTSSDRVTVAVEAVEWRRLDVADALRGWTVEGDADGLLDDAAERVARDLEDAHVRTEGPGALELNHEMHYFAAQHVSAEELERLAEEFADVPPEADFEALFGAPDPIELPASKPSEGFPPSIPIEEIEPKNVGQTEFDPAPALPSQPAEAAPSPPLPQGSDTPEETPTDKDDAIASQEPSPSVPLIFGLLAALRLRPWRKS